MKFYDPSGDSTLPTTSKKRKIEEVEPAEEEEEKPVQSKPKKIKKEKGVAAEGMASKPLPSPSDVASKCYDTTTIVMDGW